MEPCFLVCLRVGRPKMAGWRSFRFTLTSPKQGYQPTNKKTHPCLVLLCATPQVLDNLGHRTWETRTWGLRGGWRLLTSGMVSQFRPRKNGRSPFGATQNGCHIKRVTSIGRFACARLDKISDNTPWPGLILYPTGVGTLHFLRHTEAIWLWLKKPVPKMEPW